jgi:hypothetical protein
MKKILLSLVLLTAIGFYGSAQVNLLQNSDMEAQGAWQVSQGNLLDQITVTFGSTENTINGGEGANLKMNVKAKGSANTNLSVYQALDLVGGEEYEWSCAMRDLSTDHDCWWIKFVYFELEPTDDTDPAEIDIARMHPWMEGKIFNFNGLFDTCTAAIAAESKNTIFIPPADGIYYVGINLGTCDSIGDYHFLVDEVKFIDPDATSAVNSKSINHSNTLKLYPNPASTNIDFTYSLSNYGDVELSLVNILGHEVAAVTRASQSKGIHKESFDCSDLKNGMYYGILRANNEMITKKVIIIK